MNKSLLPYGVKKNILLKLDQQTKNINSFDSIDDDKKVFIEEKAKRFRKIYNKENMGLDFKYKFMIYLFNIIKFDFTSEEKIAILIEVIDPNFEIYTIYELNNKIDIIRQEIKKKIGFYNKDLIKLEKLYITKFYDIDDYTFEKNLKL